MPTGTGLDGDENPGKLNTDEILHDKKILHDKILNENFHAVKPHFLLFYMCQNLVKNKGIMQQALL